MAAGLQGNGREDSEVGDLDDYCVESSRQHG